MVSVAVIHQPNYLPGLTYFDKIACCDVFIFLDNVQYTKNNWINRNKIKTPNGDQWLTVPVVTAGQLTQTINQTIPDQRSDWPMKHLNALRTYYGRAPHFRRFLPILQEHYERSWASLADLNASLIRAVCRELGLAPEFVFASELKASGRSTALLVQLCCAVGATAYLSGPGGLKYMDTSLFRGKGIELLLREFHHPMYRQLHGEFLPNMSVVDLLFNEGEASATVLRGSESCTVPLNT